MHRTSGFCQFDVHLSGKNCRSICNTPPLNKAQTGVHHPRCPPPAIASRPAIARCHPPSHRAPPSFGATHPTPHQTPAGKFEKLQRTDCPPALQCLSLVPCRPDAAMPSVPCPVPPTRRFSSAPMQCLSLFSLLLVSRLPQSFRCHPPRRPAIERVIGRRHTIGWPRCSDAGRTRCTRVYMPPGLCHSPNCKSSVAIRQQSGVVSALQSLSLIVLNCGLVAVA